jgi:hypothetical protein
MKIKRAAFTINSPAKPAAEIIPPEISSQWQSSTGTNAL